MSKNNQSSGQAKWEGKVSEVRQNRPVLAMEERKSAFQDLALAAQDGKDFRGTTLNRLVVAKDNETGLLLCGGRVQS